MPILDGPSWIDTESVNLSATAGAATDEAVRSIVRRLFEERMKLVTHHETRDVPVYALFGTRSGDVIGPNVRPSTSDCLDHGALREAAGRRRLRQTRVCGVESGITGLTFERITMTELAAALSRRGPLVDRQVVDRTGIAGRFDGHLAVGFLPAAAILTRHPVAGALLGTLGVRSLFTALPEQLGLKLDDARVPSDVLVIDRAERPGN